jgi:hypothetical protein
VKSEKLQKAHALYTNVMRIVSASRRPRIK